VIRRRRTRPLGQIGSSAVVQVVLLTGGIKSLSYVNGARTSGCKCFDHPGSGPGGEAEREYLSAHWRMRESICEKFRELEVPDLAIPSVSSDSDIIGLSGGTPALFAELFDRHAEAIHRYVSRRSGSQIADYVMSETFLVAFENRSRFDLSIQDARPWLYGIATTLMKKTARQDAQAWKGMLADGLAGVNFDQIGAAENRADAAADLRRLEKALRKLAAGDREALLLYAWADLDYDGIAVALGVPVGTVRSRLNRVRRLLRTAAQLGSALRLEEASWTH